MASCTVQVWNTEGKASVLIWQGRGEIATVDILPDGTRRIVLGPERLPPLEVIDDRHPEEIHRESAITRGEVEP